MPAPIQPHIMLIDDEPRNLDVLADILEQESWAVSAFPNGGAALRAATENPPDLVLLDVRMPGMDGYDVCRAFKRSERLGDVPILFLSALDAPEDKVRGFEAGAVDYITKPFHEAEVLARVRTHLRLRAHETHLDELLRAKSAELIEAHRRLRIVDEAKNDWLNVLSHELRTPLTGIFGVADLVLSELPDDSQFGELLPAYEESRDRLNTLIEDATLLLALDVGDETVPPEIHSVQTALAEAEISLLERKPDIALAPARVAGYPYVAGNKPLLVKALADLLDVMVCCVHDTARIRVDVTPADTSVQIRMCSYGKSLPEEDLETFFDVGGQRSLLKGGGDFGLRPALAKAILRLMNGTISVRNQPDAGIALHIELPRAHPDASQQADFSPDYNPKETVR